MSVDLQTEVKVNSNNRWLKKGLLVVLDELFLSLFKHGGETFLESASIIRDTQNEMLVSSS